MVLPDTPVVTLGLEAHHALMDYALHLHQQGFPTSAERWFDVAGEILSEVEFVAAITPQLEGGCCQ